MYSVDHSHDDQYPQSEAEKPHPKWRQLILIRHRAPHFDALFRGRCLPRAQINAREVEHSRDAITRNTSRTAFKFLGIFKYRDCSQTVDFKAKSPLGREQCTCAPTGISGRSE